MKHRTHTKSQRMHSESTTEPLVVMYPCFLCVQPYTTALFGVPFPLATPQGTGIGNLGTSPRPRFEGCARQPSGQENSANLSRVAMKPECKAAPPHIFNLPKPLLPPSHASADRRLRLVSLAVYGVEDCVEMLFMRKTTLGIF